MADFVEKRYIRHVRINFTKKRNCGHILVVGRTGAGKSMTLETIENELYEQGWKIFDLYSGDRMEQAFLSLPSQMSFWDSPKYFSYRTGVKVKRVARGLPVRLLFPMCKRLPPFIPDNGKVFTIPVNSLAYDDLRGLLGIEQKITEETLWRAVERRFTKSSTGVDLLNLLQWVTQVEDDEKGFLSGGKIPRYAVPTLRRNLRPFVDDMLFSSAKNPMAIDFKAELRDRKTVTSLITRYYYPNAREYQTWLIHYFIRNIYNAVRDLNKKAIIVMREVFEILPRTAWTPQQYNLKKNIEKYINQGRGAGKGLFFLMDSQDPAEVSSIKNQFYYSFVHAIRGADSIKEVVDESVRPYITREQLMRLGILDRGEAMVFTIDGITKKPVKIFPAPTRHREPGEDFMEIWRKEKGENKMISTKLYRELMAEEYNKSIEYWDNIKDKIKAKKMMGEMRKQARKEKKKDKLMEFSKPVTTPKRQKFDEKHDIKFDIKGLV